MSGTDAYELWFRFHGGNDEVVGMTTYVRQGGTWVHDSQTAGHWMAPGLELLFGRNPYDIGGDFHVASISEEGEPLIGWVAIVYHRERGVMNRAFRNRLEAHLEVAKDDGQADSEMIGFRFHASGEIEEIE